MFPGLRFPGGECAVPVPAAPCTAALRDPQEGRRGLGSGPSPRRGVLKPRLLFGASKDPVHLLDASTCQSSWCCAHTQRRCRWQSRCFRRNPGEASSWSACIVGLLCEASQTGGAMPSCRTLTCHWGMETAKPSVCLPRTEIYFAALKGPRREHATALTMPHSVRRRLCRSQISPSAYSAEMSPAP